MSIRSTKPCRPEEILQNFSNRYPGLFNEVATFRAANLNKWPGWCYCPSETAYACVLIASRYGDQIASDYRGGKTKTAESMEQALRELMRAFLTDPNNDSVAIDAELAPILTAWRMGMSVYRFDPDLAEALVSTPIKSLPAALLMHMPEWCVYIETPFWPDVAGFFAMLDFASIDRDATFRLNFNRTDGPPASYVLDLGASTIDEAIVRQFEVSQEVLYQMADMDNVTVGRAFGRDGGRLISRLPACISMLLYLCDQGADYAGDDRPKNPTTTKTKRGMRLFPASAPRYWNLGVKIGERLRQANSVHRSAADERNLPRPHLRRAHWHTYRVGKERTGYRVRWLHPILVGYQDE